jgi:hypothetical protein
MAAFLACWAFAASFGSENAPKGSESVSSSDALLEPFSPAFGLAVAVADFLGAALGPPAALPSAFEPADDFFDFVFDRLSDSEADEAELRIVLVVGKALVLGRREGTFLDFFFDFSSPELTERDDADPLELFLDFAEF